MSESGQKEQELNTSNSWFSNILNDGTSISDQLQAVKSFAYRAFDRLDQDGNGFISHDELESVLQSTELQPRERMFVKFLQDNHDQISDAFDERTIADGISRSDLEAYFDLIATLL